MTTKLANLFSDNLEPDKIFLRSQWMIWSGMGQAAEFLYDLDYKNLDLQNVRIDYRSGKIPEFNPFNEMATIFFPQTGIGFENVDLVLHELGHAAWYLLFTRSPKHIDFVKHDNELKGIEEGFADYFAATLVAGDRDKSVKIGANIDAPSLPRRINGNPSPLAPGVNITTVDEHLIGKKWANMLWDFRKKVGVDKANKVILALHFRPCPPCVDAPSLPDKPMAAYFELLKIACKDYGIVFNEWDDLKNAHTI